MLNKNVQRLIIHLSLIGILVVFQNCGQSQFQISESLQGEDGLSTPLTNPVIAFDETLEFYTAQNLIVTYEINVDSSDSISEVTCQTSTGVELSCDQSQVDLSELADGNHSVTVTVITERGLTTAEQVAIHKDTLAPTLMVSTAPSVITNSQSASFIYAAIDNSSGIDRIVCSLNNQVSDNCNSPVNLANLNVGQNRFQLQAFDLAGNASQIYVHNWTIDTTVPTVTIASSPATFTNSTSASLSFTGSLVTSFQCQLDDSVFAACTSPVVYNNLAANVNHVFRVRGINAAGTMSAPATASWTIDTVAPAQPALASNVSAVTELTAAQFVFSSTDTLSGVNRLECSHNQSQFTACTSPQNLVGLAVGNHSFSVRAIDNANNTSLVRTFSWQINSPAPINNNNITASLSLEYVGLNGNRENTNVVSGVTEISGVAPFLVQFDASGTRAPLAFAAQSAITDQEAFAFLNVGYRIDFGENLAETWRYPTGTSYSKNQETGPPLFSKIFKTPGTYTVRLRARDTLANESTISVRVNVVAPAATVNIATSAGSWPQFVSNRRYLLQAGGDYRSFGALETGGVHNISFEKTGAGSNPRIATFSSDGRSKFLATQQYEPRARHIRLVSIEMDHFTEGQRGFDYVGVIGGLVRRYSGGGQEILCSEGSAVVRTNCRYSRGLFFEDTEVHSTAAGSGYVMIGTLHGFHTRGTQFVHRENGQTTYGMLRLYGRLFSFRNNNWRLDVDGGAANGVLNGLFAINGTSETPWRSDDMVGPINATSNSQNYGYVGDKMILQHNQFYGPGSFLTNAHNTIGGGNPEGNTIVRPRLVGAEDNVFFPAGDVGRSIQNAETAGQHNFWRNNRKNMGAGDFVTAISGAPNRGVGDSVTFNGPYHISNQNPRPVPSNF